MHFLRCSASIFALVSFQLAADAGSVTYAPGGHAIIPTYTPPPVYTVAPQTYAPVYAPAPAPTHAPGGHAIIPSYAPAPAYRVVPQTYVPKYAPTPTYAPGGHAIIPQQAPTFSPQFSAGTLKPAGSPRGAIVPQGTIRAPSSITSTGATQRIGVTPVGNLTAAGSLGTFGTAAVGTIPPAASGRLQLTPLAPVVNQSSSTLNPPQYYIQSGTGARLTAAQIQSGNFPPETFFIDSATGHQFSSNQIPGTASSIPLSALPQTGLYPSDVHPPKPLTLSTNKAPAPGWQDRLPQYAYGTPGNPAPRNPLGPNGTGVVTQTYGQPWSANSSELHTGLDIAAPAGAPVAATVSGKVTAIGWLGCKDGTSNCSRTSAQSWGNYVVIQDQNGQAQGYLHVVQDSNLKIGDTINAGTVVGTVFENHLHYNECKAAAGCQHGAVTPAEFQKGNYLQPVIDTPDVTFSPSFETSGSTPELVR